LEGPWNHDIVSIKVRYNMNNIQKKILDSLEYEYEKAIHVFKSTGPGLYG
jgi:hypothetical protein